MAMRRRTIAAASVGIVALGIGGAAAASSTSHDPEAERREEAEYTTAHRSAARVTQAEAERTATSEHPGSIVESHLENEGAGLRWETKVSDESGEWEVQVDASSGRVASSHSED
jgi:uncharacterized membrane protein YkoI